MSSYRYIDAKISNFIHRKLATMGDTAGASYKRESAISGIYYEPLAMPVVPSGSKK